MNRGEIVWQIANGDTPEHIANNPLLAGVDLPRTGSESRAGTLVTRTLLFAGEGYDGLPVFRAYDKATGEILWETDIPGGEQTGLPITVHATRASSTSYSPRLVFPKPGSPANIIAYTLP